ncbi:MAG: hypothetical protein AAF340_08460 [Pseudomonadota bacterium]
MDAVIYLLIRLFGGGAIGYLAGRKFSLFGFCFATAILLFVMYMVFNSRSGGGAWDAIAQAGLLAFLIFPFLVCYLIASLVGYLKRGPYD